MHYSLYHEPAKNVWYSLNKTKPQPNHVHMLWDVCLLLWPIMNFSQANLIILTESFDKQTLCNLFQMHDDKCSMYVLK